MDTTILSAQTNTTNLLPSRNSGRLLGFLFLLSLIAGGTGTSLRGLTGDVSTIAFINHIQEHTSQMKLAITLDMIASTIVVGIAIFIFPFIKTYSLRLANAYLSIAGINFVIITVSNILHVGLLSVSNTYHTANVSNPQSFITLAKMFYDAYYWTHFLMLILYSIGGFVLYYCLLKTKLIPIWLSIWGLLASIIVFFGGALQIADIEVSFLLFVQNGFFMLLFITWLLIMGFSIKNLHYDIK